MKSILVNLCEQHNQILDNICTHLCVTKTEGVRKLLDLFKDVNIKHTSIVIYDDKSIKKIDLSKNGDALNSNDENGMKSFSVGVSIDEDRFVTESINVQSIK